MNFKPPVYLQKSFIEQQRKSTVKTLTEIFSKLTALYDLVGEKMQNCALKISDLETKFNGSLNFTERGNIRNVLPIGREYDKHNKAFIELFSKFYHLNSKVLKELEQLEARLDKLDSVKQAPKIGLAETRLNTADLSDERRFFLNSCLSLSLFAENILKRLDSIEARIRILENTKPPAKKPDWK